MKTRARVRRLCCWAAVLAVGWALAGARPASAAGLSDTEIADLFSQGKELFRQANQQGGTDREAARGLYQQAAMRFERIVNEGGIHNGKLFYNLGNAYFMMGDLGRAILNYRRAEPYLPNDPNLHQNLAAARAKRLDKIEEPQQTRVLKTLFFWHYDLSTQARSLSFAAVWLLLWACAAARCFRAARRIPRWPVALLAVLAGLLLSSLLVEAVARHRMRPGVIVGPEVVARKGDGTTYEPSFREPLHAGTEFTLVEKRGDWYQIELADSRRCWVARRSTELAR